MTNQNLKGRMQAMIVKNGQALFTTEDQQNMTVKNYTEQEVKKNLKKYARQVRLRRCGLLIAFFASLIFAVKCNITSYSLFAYIVAILFAAGCLLSETLYWLNRKNTASNAYIEIVVEQKKEVETNFHNSVTTGPESICYYPVLGRDSTTSYESIWYLDKEEYKRAKPGDVVQKNVRN